MIKRTVKLGMVAITAAVLLTSCYSYTSVVGNGAQGNNEVTEWNHFLIYGLAPLEISDSKAMANGASDYTIHTRQSFVNGLVSSLTFGIYTPTTTTVKY